MPAITTRKIAREAIDGFLNSNFLVSRTDSASTTSSSYVDIPGMILYVTPPVKCDMMINFAGTFSQSGLITNQARMYIAIEIDGIIVAASQFLAWFFVPSSDPMNPYQEKKHVPIIYTAKGLTPVQHIIKAKYKTAQARNNVKERSLQAVLFHR